MIFVQLESFGCNLGRAAKLRGSGGASERSSVLQGEPAASEGSIELRCARHDLAVVEREGEIRRGLRCSTSRTFQLQSGFNLRADGSVICGRIRFSARVGLSAGLAALGKREGLAS